MKQIFTPEEEIHAIQILETIQTAHDAVEILLIQTNAGQWSQFSEITNTLHELLSSIETAAEPYREKKDTILLPVTCRCAKLSLQDIILARINNPSKCKMKLQFELMPLLEEAYLYFYFWAYVDGHSEREKYYYEKEIYELASNQYINAAVESGQFKYEVSFLILAYNHLDYTKLCVESLLKNIPKGLNYELILWDNGSTDETVSYFESVCPTKLIESRINWGGGGFARRAIEGKYTIAISNDVLITPHAIENMLSCMNNDDNIAWVVPSTPNISNLQTIPCEYRTWEELQDFAIQNNVENPFRWEQRTRLCNPITLENSKLIYSNRGICKSGYLGGAVNAFPDDKVSLLIRRAGYKLVLCKDAFCHHFGSVTLKGEIKREGQDKVYTEGRRVFYQMFGVDPWGTGFCYDSCFMKRVVDDYQGHTEVLGINCGLGSNSLKIKEQIKEYCHNTDCTLSNLTDDSAFILDLKGISDEAIYLTKIGELKSFFYSRYFNYIVWETPFLTQYKFSSLLKLCMEHLTPDGKLFIKLTTQSEKYIRENHSDYQEFGNGWIVIKH